MQPRPKDKTCVTLFASQVRAWREQHAKRSEALEREEALVLRPTSWLSDDEEGEEGSTHECPQADACCADDCQSNDNDAEGCCIEGVTALPPCALKEHPWCSHRRQQQA
jgi:hypothetical protein